MKLPKPKNLSVVEAKTSAGQGHWSLPQPEPVLPQERNRNHQFSHSQPVLESELVNKNPISGLIVDQSPANYAENGDSKTNTDNSISQGGNGNGKYTVYHNNGNGNTHSSIGTKLIDSGNILVLQLDRSLSLDDPEVIGQLVARLKEFQARGGNEVVISSSAVELLENQIVGTKAVGISAKPSPDETVWDASSLGMKHLSLLPSLEPKLESGFKNNISPIPAPSDITNGNEIHNANSSSHSSQFPEAQSSIPEIAELEQKLLAVPEGKVEEKQQVIKEWVRNLKDNEVEVDDREEKKRRRPKEVATDEQIALEWVNRLLKLFEPLSGEITYVMQASRDYNILGPTISMWIKRGLIPIESQDKNKTYLDDKLVALASAIHRKFSGGTSGRRLVRTAVNFVVCGIVSSSMKELSLSSPSLEPELESELENNTFPISASGDTTKGNEIHNAISSLSIQLPGVQIPTSEIAELERRLALVPESEVAERRRAIKEWIRNLKSDEETQEAIEEEFEEKKRRSRQEIEANEKDVIEWVVALNKLFEPLSGIVTHVNLASRDYLVLSPSITRWHRRGFVEVVGQDKNKIYLDDKAVAIASAIYHRFSIGSGSRLVGVAMRYYKSSVNLLEIGVVRTKEMGIAEGNVRLISSEVNLGAIDSGVEQVLPDHKPENELRNDNFPVFASDINIIDSDEVPDAISYSQSSQFPATPLPIHEIAELEQRLAVVPENEVAEKHRVIKEWVCNLQGVETSEASEKPSFEEYEEKKRRQRKEVEIDEQIVREWIPCLVTLFEPLSNETISLSQASRDYGLNVEVISGWKDSQFLKVIGYNKNRLLVNSKTVAILATINRRFGGRGSRMARFASNLSNEIQVAISHPSTSQPLEKQIPIPEIVELERRLAVVSDGDLEEKRQIIKEWVYNLQPKPDSTENDTSDVLEKKRRSEEELIADEQAVSEWVKQLNMLFKSLAGVTTHISLASREYKVIQATISTWYKNELLMLVDKDKNRLLFDDKAMAIACAIQRRFNSHGRRLVGTAMKYYNTLNKTT